MHTDSASKDGLGYVCAYFFAFCAIGTFSPLLGQYLSSMGFSGTQIGSITASGAVVAISFSAFWGKSYKRSDNKKSLVLKLIIGAVLVCMLLSFVNIYILFLLTFCAFHFFQAPAIALLDPMTIEDGQVFGAVRKWGAIGFAIGVFISGELSELLGLSVIFFLYTGIFSLFALTLYIMSRAERRKIKAEKLKSSLEPGGESVTSGQSVPHESSINSLKEKPSEVLYKNKKYVKLVICAFFIFGTITANNTYFGFLLLESGGSLAGIGIAFLLMAGSEAPIMAWSDKLAKMFTLEKTLLFAILLSGIRFAWYSTVPSAALLTGFFVLHGLTVGIILIEFVRYVAKVVSKEELGLAVSLYYGLGAGLSGIFCQLMGGIILDHASVAGLYLFFACMNLIGAVVYIAGKLYKA